MGKVSKLLKNEVAQTFFHAQAIYHVSPVCVFWKCSMCTELKTWECWISEGGKAKQPWTLSKSLRNPEETVSEPSGKSPNPVRSKKCVIQGEIEWFLHFFQHMGQDQTKVLLINAILTFFTALVYVYTQQRTMFLVFQWYFSWKYKNIF